MTETQSTFLISKFSLTCNKLCHAVQIKFFSLHGGPSFNLSIHFFIRIEFHTFKVFFKSWNKDGLYGECEITRYPSDSIASIMAPTSRIFFDIQVQTQCTKKRSLNIFNTADISDSLILRFALTKSYIYFMAHISNRN